MYNDRHQEIAFKEGLKIEGVLGAGDEGVVYLVTSSKCKKILKIFNANVTKSINFGGTAGKYDRKVGPSVQRLRRYSESIRSIEKGLYPIDLVCHQLKLVALTYPYEKLFSVQSQLMINASIGEVILNNFCHAQAHLLRKTGIIIADPQPMVTRTGYVRMIDYGPMFVPIDDFRCLEEHYADRSFFMVLSNLHYGRQRIFEIDTTSLEDISPYAREKWIQALKLSKKNLYELVEKVMRTPAREYLNPSFYEHIAEKLPERIPSHYMYLIRITSLMRKRLRMIFEHKYRK